MTAVRDPAALTAEDPAAGGGAPPVLVPAVLAPKGERAPQDKAEIALVAAFRGGDVQAFEELYRRHNRYVQAQAARVISDAHRAEDIAQEAFLRLARQLLGSDGEIRVRAWLHRTTTNLAIDEHRRNRTARLFHEQVSPLDELHRFLEQHDEGHPERMAETSEIRDAIGRVIDLLPPRYRRILALRELGGLDYPSIAASMDISVSAVESLLFRARRRFTEVYAELTDEPARGRRPRRRTPDPGD